MKTLKLIIVFTVCLLMTGCKEYGEKRIVKLLTINNETVSLYYYDFSAEKPEYIIESKENTGVKNTLIEILSENEYDLKLCRYAVCDIESIEKDMTDIFNALIDCKFSTDIVIVEGDTEENAEKYIEMKRYTYPLYTYDYTNNYVTGVVDNPVENTKKIIVNSMIYKSLTPQHSFVFDILKNNTDNGTYTFNVENSNFSVELENISVYCCVKDYAADINVSALLKGYKGISSNEENKKIIIEYAEESLEENISYLMQDDYLVKQMKLDWFKNTGPYNNVTVKVDIM